jgi:flagellar biosynthesis anti-sigma factor FlgM
MQPLSSNPSNSASSSHTQETIQTSPNPKDKVEISTPTQQFESVSLSQTGEEIHLYTEAMTLLPDVRQERITEIQTALGKGTYSVSSENLADKIIKELSNQLPDSSSSST